MYLPSRSSRFAMQEPASSAVRRRFAAAAEHRPASAFVRSRMMAPYGLPRQLPFAVESGKIFTVTASAFVGCKADNGGAIEVYAVPLITLRDMVVQGCRASQGGAMAVEGLVGSNSFASMVANETFISPYFVAVPVAAAVSNVEATNCTFWRAADARPAHAVLIARRNAACPVGCCLTFWPRCEWACSCSPIPHLRTLRLPSVKAHHSEQLPPRAALLAIDPSPALFGGLSPVRSIRARGCTGASFPYIQRSRAAAASCRFAVES